MGGKLWNLAEVVIIKASTENMGKVVMYCNVICCI